MSSTCGRRVRISLAIVAFVTVASGALAACGSDDSSSGSTVTTKAPEEVFAPDSQVTAGLGTLRTLFQSAHDAIASKSATVSSFPAKLEDQWSAIEGTVKKNDPASYITFEDALARIDNAVKSSDAADATKAVDSFNATADAYLAKHP